MSKRNILVLALCIFMSIEAFAQEATPTESEDTSGLVEYTVTADSANLRAQPNTSAAIVGRASRGETLLGTGTETSDGWIEVQLDDESTAYIADFLVERAPQRFYPAGQPTVATVSGRGKQISDELELPSGLYRIDANVADNAFILRMIPLAGNCDEDILLNEFDPDTSSLALSAIFVSGGCSVIFETDNVDREWNLEIRDMLDDEWLQESLLLIDDGTQISAKGRQATMLTVLPAGTWRIDAVVRDRAFILKPEVALGDCSSSSVFNELDFDASELEVSSVYRAPEGCMIIWTTDNVDKDWSITFGKLR